MSQKICSLREDVIKGLPKLAALTLTAAPAPSVPTIPNCKILGFRSRNNRVYTREAVQAAAAKYEGCKVNLDHNTGSEPRKFSERFGRLVNVRFTPEGLFGDLQYNPAHPLAEAFRWWVAHDPNAIGLSHNATAEVQTTAHGTELVTEIRDVDSVDLVADPATTKGLLESYQERNVMDPMETMDQDPAVQMPPGETQPTQEADGDGDFAAHLGNAILAIINDTGMSTDDKKKKVLQALKLMDDGTEAEAMEPITEDDTPEMDGSASDVLEGEPDEDTISLPPDEVEEGEDYGTDDEAAAMEAALLGSDEEMPLPMPTKKKAEESVDPKIAALTAELDALRVQEALRVKRAKALKACKEAKLPKEAITKVFVGQLLQLKESEWKPLVADRAAIAKRTVKPISAPATVAGDTYESFVRDLLAN